MNGLKFPNPLAAPLPAPSSGLSPPIAAVPGPSPAPSSHLIGSTGHWPCLLPAWQDMTSSDLHKAAC